MSRLIDADAFVKEMCNNCDGWCEDTKCDCLNCKKTECRCDLINELMEAQTVDAVPVVRCRECKHGHPAEDKYGEYLYCDISGEDNYDPDFYCANGERKGRDK